MQIHKGEAGAVSSTTGFDHRDFPSKGGIHLENQVHSLGQPDACHSGGLRPKPRQYIGAIEPTQLLQTPASASVESWRCLGCTRARDLVQSHGMTTATSPDPLPPLQDQAQTQEGSDSLQCNDSHHKAWCVQ